VGVPIRNSQVEIKIFKNLCQNSKAHQI